MTGKEHLLVSYKNPCIFFKNFNGHEGEPLSSLLNRFTMFSAVRVTLEAAAAAAVPRVGIVALRIKIRRGFYIRSVLDPSQITIIVFQIIHPIATAAFICAAVLPFHEVVADRANS